MARTTPDLYEILGVDAGATQEDIETAYYRAVRRHPPEKDEEGFRRVHHAFEVLGDPRSRAEYDQERDVDPEVRRLIDEARRLLEADNPEALLPLRRAAVRLPESLVVRDLLVQALMLNDELESAERHARWLVERAPENPAYHVRLGDVLRRQDRDDEAEGPYRSALDLDRNSTQPVLRLAYLLNYLDRPVEAEQLLRWAIGRDGRVDFDDFVFFRALCHILITQGRMEGLERVQQEIREILPPDPETRSYVAWSYFSDALMLEKVGRYEAALKMIDEAAALEPALPHLADSRKRITLGRSVSQEAHRLLKDECIIEPLRAAAALLALTRIAGDDEAVHTAAMQAAEALGEILLTEGEPVLENLELIRGRYPGLTEVTADFLETVREGAGVTPKPFMLVKCPKCGQGGRVKAPDLDELVKMGLTREEAIAVLRLGREKAKEYLVFKCPECGAAFNGRSQLIRSTGSTGDFSPDSSSGGPKSGGNGNRVVGCFAILLLSVLVGAVLFSPRRPAGVPKGSPKSGNPAFSVGPTPRPKMEAWVTAHSLNLREAPSMGARILTHLRRFDTVSVLSKPSGAWVRVRGPKGHTGYVAARFLEPGDGGSAKDVWCRENGGPRPANGEILVQVVDGRHSITVHNAPGADAMVKLKRPQGQTVLAFYVRAGQTARVSTVPDGVYTVFFGSGRTYSRRCGRFMTDFTIRKIPQGVAFETRYQGNVLVYRRLDVTLFPVPDGNLILRRASEEEFLD